MIIIENIVNTINSIVGTANIVFSSFITVNYHIGDLIATCISYVYTSIISALSTFILVVSILLEDLLVFFNEISESASNCLLLFLNCFFIFRDFVFNILSDTSTAIVNIFDSIISYISIIINTIIFTVQKCGEIFSLIGHSLILLVNLLPRTLYLLYLGTINLIHLSKERIISSSCDVYQKVISMSGEMWLGVVSTIIVSVLGGKYTLKFVRENNITWGSVVRAIVWLLCNIYIWIFESIVKCLRMTVRVMEMTVSNLRVPMFAHAGDSEDEEEDRENLVGDVEDSDDEENDRRETRRRNYLLLLERARKRKGSDQSGGSRDDVEEELLREVEREREDKLCCICQDREKCIMMLPCRHLCICERCQALLKNHGNSCPMCRRQVKQMIKAYL